MPNIQKLLVYIDEACQWKLDFIKKIEPAQINNNELYSTSAVQHFCNNKSMHYKIKFVTIPNETEENQFLDNLSKLKWKPALVYL